MRVVTELQRECDGCTACCEGWTRTNIDGQELSAGNPCRHLGKKGCSIYAMRPKEPCATFMCGWLLSNDIPDWMKPNNSKAIIKPNYIWEMPSLTLQIHVALACGPKIPGKTRQWLQKYAQENDCNFLCNEPTKTNKKYDGGLRKFGIGSDMFVAKVNEWVENDYDFYVKPSPATMVIGERFFKTYA